LRRDLPRSDLFHTSGAEVTDEEGESREEEKGQAGGYQHPSLKLSFDGERLAAALSLAELARIHGHQKLVALSPLTAPLNHFR